MLGQGQFDMIFLDHFLKDGTSIDFLGKIQKEGIETPVIVVSGHGDEMLASQVIQSGPMIIYQKAESIQSPFAGL